MSRGLGDVYKRQHLDPQGLRDELSVLREEKGQNKKFKLWKGRNRNEKKN